MRKIEMNSNKVPDLKKIIMEEKSKEAQKDVAVDFNLSRMIKYF